MRAWQAPTNTYRVGLNLGAVGLFRAAALAVVGVVGALQPGIDGFARIVAAAIPNDGEEVLLEEVRGKPGVVGDVALEQRGLLGVLGRALAGLWFVVGFVCVVGGDVQTLSSQRVSSLIHLPTHLP